MQFRGHTGGHYDPRYLNADIIAFPGLIPPQGDITQSHGLRFNMWFPPSNVNYYNEDHQRDIYRQIMLKHEATFKYQVHELHRVYGRQRELMEEIRKREMLNHNLKPCPFSGLRSDFILPSGNHYHAPQTKPSSLASHLFQEPYSPQLHPGQQLAKGVTIREFEPSKSHIKQPRKRMLDLELPAYEYIDSDDENVVQEQPIGSKIESFSSGNAKILFDLNSPAQVDESDSGHDPVASFTVPEIPKVVDLNMLPADISSEDEHLGHNNMCDEKPRINLNSSLDEEDHTLLLPPPPDQSDKIDPVRQSGLEAPLSPENKECAPPRGDSEDNQTEAGTQEEDEEGRVAADTLFVISSSGKQRRCSTTIDMDQNENFDDTLDWFAGIATSTSGIGRSRRSSKALERTVCLAVWGKRKRRKTARVA